MWREEEVGKGFVINISAYYMIFHFISIRSLTNNLVGHGGCRVYRVKVCILTKLLNPEDNNQAILIFTI